MEKKCQFLASWLLSSREEKSAAAFEQLLEQHKLEYRKGKGVADVRNACKKAMRPCMSQYSTENEIDICAIYLQGIVKKRR